MLSASNTYTPSVCLSHISAPVLTHSFFHHGRRHSAYGKWQGSVISAYETDLRLPSYDILIKLSAIFGVTTDYLLGINHGQLIDISGLSEADSQMVIQLINRLKN